MTTGREGVLRVSVGRKGSFECWWLHVGGDMIDCYFTRWGAMRAARRYAKAYGLTRQQFAEPPYQYGFSKFAPVATWGLMPDHVPAPKRKGLARVR